MPRYRPGKPHYTIAEQLERVERREIDRLMLLCPPRHGKSELASRRFPAFYLGRHPHHDFISAAANDSLAQDHGRDVRNIVSSEEYAAIFDTRLSEDSQAKGKWHTSDGGLFFTVGVGAGAKGRGAHVLLIDDPFATMHAALSEVERKRVWEWYMGTLYDRLMPGGAIIVINHRMHEEDLTGMLLQQQAAGGDTWEVVELPAVSGEGENREALWPEAYPLEALDRIRRNIEPRFWSALYQQKPTPDEGSYFKRDWFEFYDDVPSPKWARNKRMRIYGASDYATKDGQGDYTVHVVVGIDEHDDMYVLDLWRDQKQSDVWVDAFCGLILRWKPLAWGEPRDQIRHSLGPFIKKRMRERKAYCRRIELSDSHDKVTKARSFQGRAAMGKVHLPRDAEWVSDALHELTTFDAGKHDDICLASGTLITMSNGDRKPIECVKSGDFVATPDGTRRVSAAAMTKRDAKVLKVFFSDGRELVGTASHLIYVENKGFVRLDALRVMDTVCHDGACEEVLRRQRWSSIWGTDTAAIRTVQLERISAIFTVLSRAAASCIDMYGRMSPGRFLRAATSITLMATRLITALRTLSASLCRLTQDAIRWGSSAMSVSFAIWIAYETRQLAGTSQMMVASGTESMAAPPGLAASDIRKSAKLVSRPFWQRSQRARGSARPLVLSVTATEALTAPMEVHNLTVDGAHVYYANGVLTHNCDALGVLGRMLDLMVKGKPLLNGEDKPDRWDKAFRREARDQEANSWRTT